MEIVKVSNPRYALADGSVIDLDLEVRRTNTSGETVVETLEFSASPSDDREYGRVLYENAKIGLYGAIAPYNSDEREV